MGCGGPTVDDCGKLVQVHLKKRSLNSVRTLFMDPCARHMPCSITTEREFLRSVIIERLATAQEKGSNFWLTLQSKTPSRNNNLSSRRSFAMSENPNGIMMALRAFDSLHLATCYCTNNGCGCALNLWRMRTDGLGNKLVSPGSTPTEDSPENPQLIRIIFSLLGVSPSLLSRLLSPGARKNDAPLQRQSILTKSVPGTLSQ